MLCKNCNKEIGQQASCQYCGFNPVLDSGENPICNKPGIIKPKPIKMKLIQTTNGAAIAALVLTFMMPGPLSMLFGIIGLSKVKVTHSGRGMSIFSIIAGFLVTAAIVALYAFMLKEAGVEFQM